MTVQNEDRRKYTRFSVREGVYAFIDNIPFTVQDISEGGMKIQSVVFDDALLENMKIDIFVNNGKFYLKNVPVRLVRLLQDESTTPFSTIHVKRIGFEFENLTDQQKLLLDNLITFNTVGEA
jgi:c-di-GMP-binding flagellar brake protein YcgR